jgi:hypothetical protein
MIGPENELHRPIPQDAIDPQIALEVFYGEDRRACGTVTTHGAPPVADASGVKRMPQWRRAVEKTP